MHRDKLLKAVEIMAQEPGAEDSRLVAALIQAGFQKADADRLVAFVPMAFSRPLLEQLGVSQFSETVSAKNRFDRWVELPLSGQPIYVTALSLAREQWRGVGKIDKEAYKTLAQRCASIDAANNALNAGADVKGAAVAIALNSLKAEALLPVPWFIRLKRAVLG